MTTFSGTLTGSDGSTLTVTSATLTGAPPPAPTPVPVPVPTPVPSARRTLALYFMMWAQSGSPQLATIPAEVTELRLAFAQGSPPRLVGSGPYASPSALVQALAPLRARGVRVVLSIGGQGGAITTGARDTFLAGVAAAHSAIGFDGLDWDVEVSSLVSGDVVAISQTLHDRYGWQVSMAPNGSSVGQYLPVAVALNAAGLLSHYGQQFYDAPVSVPAAAGRISQAIAAGLPVGKVGVGMMIGADASHWTPQQCVDNCAALAGQFPGLGGGYFWEASRAGTYDAIVRVAKVFA